MDNERIFLMMQGSPQRQKRTVLSRATRWLVFFLSTHACAVFGFNFNVSLVSLTNHNTSAFSNYNVQNFPANFAPTSWVSQAGATIPVNTNLMDVSLNPITPGHVSKVNVHTLIPSRPDLRWFAHATPWFAPGSGHPDIGVNNNTTAYVASMVTDMENRGFNGVVIDWYGQNDVTDQFTQKLKAYLAGISTNTFTYIIMVDKGVSGGLSTNNLVSQIQYCQSQYFSDPNYEKEPVSTGEPILMFFGVRSAIGQTNMTDVKAETGGNMVWVEQGTGYLSETWEDECFEWTDQFDTGVNPSDPFNLNSITSDYSTIQSSGKKAFAAMCVRFNGTLTESLSWSLGKYLPSSNGVCEIQRAGKINSAMITNFTRMQWPTWSDWQEGTEVEGGVENSFGLTAQVNSANLLTWTVTNGSEATIDHYEVYASSNGVTAALLGIVLSGTHIFNVGADGLSPGTYQFYVDAVGKPCIRDHMSAAVSDVLEMPPQITQQPTNESVSYGGTANFNVSVTGTAPFSYTWYDQNSNVVSTTSNLVVSNATQNNIYFAVVSNQYGTNSSASATLTVLVSPVVQTDVQPLSQTVWQGDQVTFSVVAGGETPFNYQWTLNGQNIDDATNSSYSFAALAGTNSYQVLISNGVGSTNSSIATVIGIPATFINPTNYHAMQITFTGYTNSGTLLDFPVLVRLSMNIPGFSYSQFISPNSGADLRFAAENGRELPFEIDQWNPNGQSQAWVQVPSIATTNDYITAYWGNSADSATQPWTTNGMVWSTLSGSNDFTIVYHMAQNGLPVTDSTLQYSATSGVAPGLTNGVVGNGLAFNGSSSFLAPSGAVNLGSAFSLSAWVNLNPSSTNIQTVWANKAAGGSSNGVALFVNTYNSADGALLLETGDGTPSTPITAISVAHAVGVGGWHHVFASEDRNAGTAALYVDGVNVTAPGTNAIVTDFANNGMITLGSFTNNHWFLNGAMDEARIESGVRSPSWVWASWATVAETNFATFGSVVLPPVSLQAQAINGQVVLIWTGGVLQSAPNVAGPYTDMTSVASPYTNIPASAQQFYRVRVQ